MEDIRYADWDASDFRYAEERTRVTAAIRLLATEKDFSHAEVQEMMIKTRWQAPNLVVTVRFKRKSWVEAQIARHVTARFHFNEDCSLQERTPNPEWDPEEDN